MLETQPRVTLSHKLLLLLLLLLVPLIVIVFIIIIFVAVAVLMDSYIGGRRLQCAGDNFFASFFHLLLKALHLAAKVPGFILQNATACVMLCTHSLP